MYIDVEITGVERLIKVMNWNRFGELNESFINSIKKKRGPSCDLSTRAIFRSHFRFHFRFSLPLWPARPKKQQQMNIVPSQLLTRFFFTPLAESVSNFIQSHGNCANLCKLTRRCLKHLRELLIDTVHVINSESNPRVTSFVFDSIRIRFDLIGFNEPCG